MDLDATDAAILRCLQENARASMRTIAKKVGVSVPTVSARLRNLEQLGVIRGYRVLLGSDLLEATGIALVVKTKPHAADGVADHITERPWARRVMIGRAGSVLVDVSVGHPADLDRIVAEIRGLGGVTDLQEYAGLKTVKDEPAPLPEEGLTANVACFECGGPIHGQPIKARLDGRYHYFCCPTCERLYLEKYARIRAAVGQRS